MHRWVALSVLCLCVSACGDDASPTGPGPTTPPPTTTLRTVTGQVTSSGAAVPNATVTIMDSVNAGHARTTDAGGAFSFTNLTPAVFTLQATAAGYDPQNRAVDITQGNQSVLFSLVKPNPIFQKAGVGDAVFDVPTYVRRIRIQGSTSSRCQNFAVRIAGRLLVNVILGTCSVADARSHDGTYLTSGGVAEVTISSGVSWIFTEIR